MMHLENIKTITVLGSGVMGHGIAQGFLMGGYPVTLYDINSSVLEIASSHIHESLSLFCEAGLLKKEEIASAMARLTLSTDLKAATKESDFIIEVIPEIMELKQNTLKAVESYCKKETIIASNTSHLRVSDVFSKWRIRAAWWGHTTSTRRRSVPRWKWSRVSIPVTTPCSEPTIS